MSFGLMGKIVEDLEITDSFELNVLLALAVCINWRTGLSTPSLKRLAELARCSRDSVIRALKRLEKKRWISVLRHKNQNPGVGLDLSNSYKILRYAEERVVAPSNYLVAASDWGSSSQRLGVVATSDSPPLKNPLPWKTETSETPPTPPEGGTTRMRARNKPAANIDLLSLPLFLASPDFRKALQDLIDHRAFIKHPMNQRALELVVAKCEKWGKEDAIRNINLSIERGWQGVFAPKPDEIQKPKPPKDRDLIF